MSENSAITRRIPTCIMGLLSGTYYFDVKNLSFKDSKIAPIREGVKKYE